MNTPVPPVYGSVMHQIPSHSSAPIVPCGALGGYVDVDAFIIKFPLYDPLVVKKTLFPGCEPDLNLVS